MAGHGAQVRYGGTGWVWLAQFAHEEGRGPSKISGVLRRAILGGTVPVALSSLIRTPGEGQTAKDARAEARQRLVLLARFQSVEDIRCVTRVRHTLKAILGVMTFGSAAIGGDSITAIGDWAHQAPQDMLAALGCWRDPLTGLFHPPSERTLRRSWPWSTATTWTGNRLPTWPNHRTDGKHPTATHPAHPCRASVRLAAPAGGSSNLPSPRECCPRPRSTARRCEALACPVVGRFTCCR
jgi:hypothetical protein